MRLSRKPKTLIIMFVMAMFLMTQAGIASAAVAAVNVVWNPFGTIRTNSIVSGTVYQESTSSNVYATVYASIQDVVYGTYTYYNTPIVVADYVYSPGKTFNIGLSNFTGLTVGRSYKVGLNVYAANTAALIDLTSSPQQELSSAFTLYAYSPSSSGGGSSGSTTTTPPTPLTTTGSSVTAATGGTVSASGVNIVIPAGALLGDAKVTIAKITNLTGLPVDAATKLVSDVLEITKDKIGNFSKPVTLTLNFDKSKVDTTKFDLFVCYLDEATNKWVKLDNVKVDMATGTVSGDTLHFTKFAVIAFDKSVAPAVKLTDIAGNWAEANILKLVALGAIAGNPDGTFKPSNNITRAEFATVLAKAFKLAPATNKVFSDTTNHWAKDSISAAAGAGIVSGYSATTFGPNDPITREQMAVMIVKAAKLATAKTGNTFTDSAKISAWAKAAVDSASENKIIAGNPDKSFKPQGLATRAEAVTVIANTLK